MLEETSGGTLTTHSPSYLLLSQLTGPPLSDTLLTDLFLCTEGAISEVKNPLLEALPGSFHSPKATIFPWSGAHHHSFLFLAL